MRYLLRIFVLANLLVLCSCSAGVQVEIANRSGQGVAQLEVRAGHALVLIGRLDSQSKKIATIVPVHDSALELGFRTENGTVRTCQLDVYLTRVLRGQIRVAINKNFGCELHEIVAFP